MVHHRSPLVVEISIHAPRVGSDTPLPRAWQIANISIHAPRVGSDFHKHPNRPGF